MEKRIFDVREHYLVEVDEPHSGFTKTSKWEILIAVKLNDDEYQGKAVEFKDQKRVIHWMTIPKPHNGLDYMIQAIENHIKRF
jgi:hypothetical protein